jgi:hypothetical protein
VPGEADQFVFGDGEIGYRHGGWDFFQGGQDRFGLCRSQYHRRCRRLVHRVGVIAGVGGIGQGGGDGGVFG